MPKDIDHLPGETAIHARRVVQKITPIEWICGLGVRYLCLCGVEEPLTYRDAA
jgi:hypothetical protein